MAVEKASMYDPYIGIFCDMVCEWGFSYLCWMWLYSMYLTSVIRRGKWILSVNRLMGDWMLQVNKCWLWCFVMQMIGFWMSLIFLFWRFFIILIIMFYSMVLDCFVMVKMILNNDVNTAVCFVNWYIYIY